MILTIHFPNGEAEDISNDKIELDSFKFNESLCSAAQLKFGLCEAASLEFTAHDIQNIKFYQIEATLSDLFGSTSLGRFSVDSCDLDIVTGARRVIAYGPGAYQTGVQNAVELFKRNLVTRYQAPYTPDRIKIALADIGNLSIAKTPYAATWTSVTGSTIGPMTFTFQFDEPLLPLINVTLTAMFTSAQTNLFSDRSKLFYYDSNKPTPEPFTAAVDALLVEVDEMIQLEASASSHIGELRDKVREAVVNAVTPFIRFPTWYGSDYSYKPLQLPDSGNLYPYIDGTASEYAGAQNIIFALPKSMYFRVKIGSTTQNTTTKQLYTEDASLWTYDIGDSSFRDRYERKNVAGGYQISGSHTDQLDVLEAWAELQSCFGRYSRSEDSYVFSGLGDESEAASYDRRFFPVDYSEAAYSETISKPYRAVRCEYGDAIYEAVIIEDVEGSEDYQTYDISDNYLISNTDNLSASQVLGFCQAIADNIAGLQYHAFTLSTGKGRPAIEAGDWIEIRKVGNESAGIVVPVLERSLSGLPAVADEYKAQADTMARETDRAAVVGTASYTDYEGVAF